MESLEIVHKLLQLITRTLIQMITQNQKVGNLLSCLLAVRFLLLLCVFWCMHVCLSVCRNVPLFCAFGLCVSLKGQRVGEGPEVRCTLENGQGPKLHLPSSHPSSLTLGCHGMSPWVTVSLATKAL